MKYIDLLAQDRSCPFCCVDDSTIVMRNDVGYVTPALAPYGDLHALVCSWVHRESVLDFSSEEYGQLMDLVRKTTESFYGLGSQEVTVLVRDSRDFMSRKQANSTSGKTAMHYHIHILGDVQMIAKHLGNQESSDSRLVLTDDQMRKRTVQYRVFSE